MTSAPRSARCMPTPSGANMATSTTRIPSSNTGEYPSPILLECQATASRAASDGVDTALLCPDAHDVLDGRDPDLPVADLAGGGGVGEDVGEAEGIGIVPQA